MLFAAIEAYEVFKHYLAYMKSDGNKHYSVTFTLWNIKEAEKSETVLPL